MQETINNASAASSTLFLGHTGEWWDFWLIISVIFAAFVAAAVGVTTMGSIVAHKREVRAAESALSRFKAAMEKDVAEANARSDEANKKAQDERLERVKLEASIAPRRLSSAAVSDLKTLFSKFPMRQIAISSYELDAEAAVLGQQIIDATNGSEVAVRDMRMSEGALGSINFGIFITGDDASLVSALSKIFVSSGLTVWNIKPTPTTGISLGGQDAPAAAKIFIGVKPIAK